MGTSQQSAKAMIEKGEWVECWICRDVFKRRTMTRRYCYHCDRGFCEGQHGTFEGRGIGVCLGCYGSRRNR